MGCGLSFTCFFLRDPVLPEFGVVWRNSHCVYLAELPEPRGRGYSSYSDSTNSCRAQKNLLNLLMSSCHISSSEFLTDLKEHSLINKETIGSSFCNSADHVLIIRYNLPDKLISSYFSVDLITAIPSFTFSFCWCRLAFAKENDGSDMVDAALQEQKRLGYSPDIVVSLE